MQTPGVRRSSMKDAAHQPPASALPRPVISTEVDVHRNAPPDLSSPFLTTTPEAISFYRNASSPISGVLPSQSFDATNVRTVSGPPQSAPREVRSQPRLMKPKRSVRDLASQFDQASNGKVPLPAQSNGLRSASASASTSPIPPTPSPKLPSSEARPPRKLQKTPPLKRRSTDTPESRVSRLGSTDSSPSSTFHTSTQDHNPSSRPQYLFGEIDTLSPGGATLAHGIPRERHRRVSEGNIHEQSAASGPPDTSDAADPRRYSALRPGISHLRSTSESNAPSPIQTSSSRRSLEQISNSFAHQLERRQASISEDRQSRIPLARHRENSLHRRPPSRRATTPPQQLSYRQFDMDGGDLDRQEDLMRSFIRAPSPQKSPPLRSSRPRQQVSSLTHGGASSFNSHMASRSPESRDSIIDDRTYTPPEFPTSFSRQGSYTQSSAGNQEPVKPAKTPSILVNDAAQHEELNVSRLQQLSNAIYYGSPVKSSVYSRPRQDVEEHRPLNSAGAEGVSTDIEDDALSSPRRSSFAEDHDDSPLASPDHNFSEPIWPKPPTLSIQTHHDAPRKAPVLISGPGQPSPAMSSENENGETIHIILGATHEDSRESRVLDSGFAHRADTRHGSEIAIAEPNSDTPIQHDLPHYLSAWTSTTADSPLSGRLALDNDGYNIFHNIIQQYQESGALSPQLMEEMEKHVIEPGSSISPRDVLQELIQEGALSHRELEESPVDEPMPLRPSRFNVAAPPGDDAQHTPSSRLSVHTDIDDNASSAAEEESRDRGGVFSSANEIEQSPQVGSDDGTTSTATQRIDRFSTQTMQSTNSDRPSLPEIADTGGVLGLLEGNSQQVNKTGFASAASLPVELPAHERPREPSGSFSVASSDVQQAMAGQGMTTPDQHAQDTPATTVSHPPSLVGIDHIPPSTTVERDLAPTMFVPSSGTNDERRLNQRKHCINELINTEFSFHRDMTVVEDIYIATASSCSDLNEDDTRVLFGNTAQLVSFSRQLADNLKEAARGVYQKAKKTNDASGSNRGSQSTSSSGQNGLTLEGSDEERDRQTYIGEVFLQNMVTLEKIYADYLRNHDAANQRLTKVQQKDGAKIWLAECHNYAKDLTGAWNLDSMLIKPTQRVLKYPLLLDAILKQTPEDHPDYTALELANKEIINATQRINEAKRRAELVEQVVNPRTRRDLDMTKGFQKAFGRRADKLRQQVGITEAIEDPDYRAIAQKFGSQHLQLQVAMKDVEMYRSDGESFMRKYGQLAACFEEVVDVGATPSPEIESKWRRWAMTVRELYAIAWTDHTAEVLKHCVDPMRTLLNMFERPQTLMAKRKKRLPDYAKFKTMKDRNEKPDKKTNEQAEQFTALNETLKEELPKLFATSARLVEACLKNFIQLSTAWNQTWERKMTIAVEDSSLSRTFDEIVSDFNSDHQYNVEDVLSLGICNGSLLNDTSNFLASSTASTIDRDDNRSGRPSISSGARKESSGSQTSFAYPPYTSNRTSAGSNSITPYTGPRPSTDSANRSGWSNGHAQHQRMRSHSGSTTNRKPVSLTPPMRPPPIPNNNQGNGTFLFTQTPPVSSAVAHSYEAASRQQQRPQYLADLSNQGAYQHQQAQRPTNTTRPSSSNTYYTASSSAGESRTTRSSLPSTHRTPPAHSSNVFSSALPMTDDGIESRRSSEMPSVQPSSSAAEKPYRVLFLAASLFDFNIDRARTEAGYPYLTYLPGEIFDVIGEKGELWLAKNQDDPTSAIGWIWEKHFAKLTSIDAL